MEGQGADGWDMKKRRRMAGDLKDVSNNEWERRIGGKGITRKEKSRAYYRSKPEEKKVRKRRHTTR